MSRTIFNTQRTVKSSGQVASSEYALVTIGGRTELGQSVSGTYTRQIRDLYELGSTTVLWLTGREMGNMTFNRLVGGKGFFDGWEGEDCGEIRPVSINLSGGPCVAAASGGLQFQSIMIEGLNFSMSTGALEITEGITMRFASMSRA